LKNQYITPARNNTQWVKICNSKTSPNVLSKITQHSQEAEDKGFNSKPEAHNSGAFCGEYNRKKIIKKGETNRNWQKIYNKLNDEIKIRD